MIDKYINGDFIKFNSFEKTVKLDDRFIVGYRYFDGYSHRLLHVGLYIDSDYNFVCYMTSSSKSVLCEKHGFSLLFEGTVPESIKHPLSILVNDQFRRIKNEYREENFVASGMSGVQFFFNLNEVTTPIYIEDNLYSDEALFTSKNEKRLYRLNQQMMNWFETIYESISTENSQ